jgi:CP family cyanate transporter-like MFS transporter
MISTGREVRPLWMGRTTALLGILLLAVNLRTAVAALSPIIPRIAGDIPLDSVGLGFIGMLPPIAFAVSGLLAPLLAKRIGLESSLVLACVAMVAGPIIRAAADSYLVLVAGSIVALAGMGFGNILLPPAVKKYFPDRIGLVTTLYATLLSVSATIAPIVAEPLASIAGWRISVGVWAVLAFSALFPWFIVRIQHAGEKRRDADAGIVEQVQPALLGSIWRSRSAWAITMVFAVSSFGAYSAFAWLPSMLVDIADATPSEAGALLGLFAIMGLPAGLFIPLLAVRMRNISPLIHLGVGFMVVGYLGLLLLPTTATWVWVACAGLGPLVFPLCLVLINLRTHTHQASVALSGFVQSIGYAMGSLGPLLVGLLHDTTADWGAPLIFLAVISLIASGAAFVLAKPTYIEDELAAQTA